ncbi:MucR family transcriptional regulator [Methylobacterium sp. J-090]|uniref:MucR family transcriptional regulator n=1 Tax=Methylobacterium sp. J-090 TaxID=2836666 RepID=UPI001FBBC29F|nr:MucR family transcriptional regulator [Methylobacterium sp. J-090]MCJ2080284.1 MucR family transcriptional regulator [Methylobacterium sp. J-090]
MNEDSNFQETALIDLAGDIVSAFVSNNSVPVADLPVLIRNVHAALSGLATGTAQPASQSAQDEAIEKPTAAQIRKSLTPDGIVSFVDGKTYKTMKRHLTTNGFDPQSYRQRFGLPADYPMVAPNYAAQRSALAKSIGLGRPGGRSEAAQTAKAPDRKQAA